MMLKYISLFSGIGGFDLGFDRAGMECVLQVEKDEKARAILAHHWPNVPKMELVEDVTKESIRQLGIETVDLLCGGFPCQDLSVAGQRKGLAGERSGLWFEFLRVIKELRPGWVVIENVPGLLSSNKGRDMGTVLGGLGQCGYWWAYRVFDSQFFGVPQRRRRVFIVASLRKFAPQEVLFERESSPWDTPPSREKGAGIAQAAIRRAQTSSNGWGIKEDGSTGTVDPSGGDAVLVAHSVRPRSGMPQGWKTGLNVMEDQSGTLQENQIMAVAYGGNNTSGEIDLACAILAHGSGRYNFESETFITNAFNGYTGGADDNDAQGNHLVVSLAGTLPADYGKQGCNGMGEMEGGILPVIAPTLSAESFSPSKSSSGQQVDWYINAETGVRRLTPIECERLQGFPEIEKCVIIDVCLDHQNNSASVEIQSLKSLRPVGNVEKTGLLDLAKSAEPSSRPSNQSNSELAQRTVLIYCEESRVVIHNQEKCFLSANFAEGKNLFPRLTRTEDFALLVAGLNSIVERITPPGKVGLPANEILLTPLQSGKPPVRLSGKETMQLVNDAIAGSITNKELLKSIISNPLGIKSSEPTLITLFSSVLSAIGGYIPPEILKSNSFRIEITSSFGWTFPQSDSARYRQLGNAVCMPVARWIGRRIKAICESLI